MRSGEDEFGFHVGEFVVTEEPGSSLFPPNPGALRNESAVPHGLQRRYSSCPLKIPDRGRGPGLYSWKLSSSVAECRPRSILPAPNPRARRQLGQGSCKQVRVGRNKLRKGRAWLRNVGDPSQRKWEGPKG